MWRPGIAVAVLFVMIFAPNAIAQRGAQHLNSPGFQRALAESRKPKLDPAPAATVVRKKRHRYPRVE